MHSLPRLLPRPDRRNALGEHFSVQVLVLLLPRVGLLLSAAVSGALLCGVGKQPESTSGSRPVARKAEDDGGLVGAIQRREEMPPRIGDYLS